MNIIQVESVGKKYKTYRNQFDRLFEWFIGRKKHEEKWVLSDISFNVKAGESIGIVGHNGAGKSTLLKIITGTTSPSIGKVSVNGRITALLELGMGFHPDFTGIQNVYMSAQLMGLDNKKIETLIPEIEAFAEIGDYFYQPLRTYSSGMVVRLGFAVATVIRPDVLIVDEALSVGDAYFQHKCFERIKSFRNQGTTIFFVSHDPGAVKNLCDRAILLDQGKIIQEGRPDEILDYYNAIIAKRQADFEIKQNKGKGNKISTRSGNKSVVVKDVLLTSEGKDINAIQVADEIELQITIECLQQVVENPTVGFMIKDRLGNEIYGTNTHYLNAMSGKIFEGETKKITFKIPANFGMGTYSITVAVHEGNSHVNNSYDWWDQASTFQVIPGNQPYFVGVNYIPITVEIN